MALERYADLVFDNPLFSSTVRTGAAIMLTPYHDPNVQSTANAAFQRDLAQAAHYAGHARSRATLQAYARDLADFRRYCEDCGVRAQPAEPQTVAAYVASQSRRLKLTSIRRRLVAIAQAHKRIGLASPTSHPMVREVLRGVARDTSVQLRSRTRKKTALTPDRLLLLIAAIDRSTLRGQRDRAIILLGWAAALRRSELAALDVGDIDFNTRGVTVFLRSSKTDQTAIGCTLDIPYVSNDDLCAVRALEAWIAAASLSRGPLFISFARGDRPKASRIDPIDVARCLQRAALAGALAGDFAGHSLRRGYITSAIRSGAHVHDVMRRTRHKSHAVFAGYVEESLPFASDALSRMLDAGQIAS